MKKKIILDETALEKFDPTVATLQAMVDTFHNNFYNGKKTIYVYA